MKIFKLNTNPNLYSGNSYLLLGAFNTITDVNAVIDTGSDDYIIGEIEKIYTGVGKNPVDKIVLTHNHFDHMGGAARLKKRYNAKVYANIASDEVVDYKLNDGDTIKLAEHDFIVIHTPGHSTDSICLYCENEQVLFSGDTNLQIRDSKDSFTEDFIESIQKLSRLKIKTIYPGHGNPISESPEDLIKTTIKNVLQSKKYFSDC